MGADAVGYTLYVGTPAQEQDFEQLRKVREDAQRYGMPLIVWAYPRGEAIEAKGGKSSFYAVDYAARTAAELGADMVKVNFPTPTNPSASNRMTRSSPARTRSTRSSGRPTGPCCWCPAASGPATTPCWRRPANPWKRVPPG
ncbi:hypothetical protein GCM10029964_086410 [Kibdelosporangium lantanae]